MRNKGIKSVIFDMDGTLLDSSYALTKSVNYVREKIGLEPLSQEGLEHYINEPNYNLSMIFYGTKEYKEEHRTLFRNHYLENANSFITPYEGSYELLDFLQSKNISINIATNAPDYFAKSMLKHTNMLGYFSNIVGANNVNESKPNPEMLEYIFKQTNIPNTQSILIGDSKKDEKASQNANVKFIFASWGYGKSDNASLKFDNLSEVIKYFENLMK